LDSTFVHLPISEALELLETSLGEVSKQVEELESEKGECEEGMEGLKKVLYEKFGSESLSSLLHVSRSVAVLTWIYFVGTHRLDQPGTRRLNTIIPISRNRRKEAE